MVFSFACIGAYVLLLGVASFVERPVGRGFDAFQLNALVRGGGLAIGLAALVASHDFTLPAPLPLLAGLTIGVIAGIGSICYCLALGYLPVSIVVACADLYIVVTVLIGIVILREAVTPLKVVSLAMTLIGVLTLSYTPGRHGVQPGETAAGTRMLVGPFVVLAGYVALIVTSTFLEKPALRGLDAMQLNAFQAIGMVAVASIALMVRGSHLCPTRHALEGALVGTMRGTPADVARSTPKPENDQPGTSRLCSGPEARASRHIRCAGQPSE